MSTPEMTQSARWPSSKPIPCPSPMSAAPRARDDPECIRATAPPIATAWTARPLVVPDGWLVHLESGTDFVLVDLDGNIRTAIDMTLVPEVWDPDTASWPEAWGYRTVFWPGLRNTHFYLEPFELAGAASLGPPPEQDRPVDEPDEDPAALGLGLQPGQVAPSTVRRAGLPTFGRTVRWALVAALVVAIGAGWRRRSPITWLTSRPRVSETVPRTPLPIGPVDS